MVTKIYHGNRVFKKLYLSWTAVIRLYENYTKNTEELNQKNNFYYKDFLKPGENVKNKYHKIGVNVPLGCLPGITYCVFSCIRNTENIIQTSEIKTIDNSQKILFIIKDNEIIVTN